jgi:hypothetical protein
MKILRREAAIVGRSEMSNWRKIGRQKGRLEGTEQVYNQAKEKTPFSQHVVRVVSVARSLVWDVVILYLSLYCLITNRVFLDGETKRLAGLRQYLRPSSKLC